jgi:hypothetical protein
MKRSGNELVRAGEIPAMKKLAKQYAPPTRAQLGLTEAAAAVRASDGFIFSRSSVPRLGVPFHPPIGPERVPFHPFRLIQGVHWSLVIGRFAPVMVGALPPHPRKSKSS